MAEVFGAVASGIGIAGVAAQALDGIRKLQSFCHDVRDAPEEIKYLTNALEILLGTIASIDAQIQRNSSMCQNMDPTPALRFIDQSVRSLNDVIGKLNAEIAQKRTLGSMKMAWRKKVLESHLMKIERSKTSLGLAVSAYSSELYLQTAMRTDTRIDQLSVNLTTLTASYQSRLEPASAPQINDSQQTRRNEQLVIDNRNERDWQSIRKKFKPPKRISVMSFTMMLPLWLAQRSLRIDLCRTAQSWTLSLRPYRTISGDADIWKVIAQGDFDGMRNLIESGQATVFDRRDDGWTLLHEIGMSASSYNQETFSRPTSFLIDRGADVDEPTSLGWPAVHTFCCCVNFYPLGSSTDLRNDDVFKILVDGSNLDADFVWQPFQGPFALTCSASMEQELRRSFPLDTLDFPTITMANRLRQVGLLISPMFSPKHVADYLGIVSLEIAYPTLDDESKRDLLRGALWRWGYCSAEPHKQHIHSEEWGNTIKELFALGANLELLCGGRGKEERPEVTKEEARWDDVVVEVIRQFVSPYAWHRAQAKEESWGMYDTRRFVDGFQCFVLKTEHLGIGLEAESSCTRFEICLDDEFMEWTDLACSDDCQMEAHTISLYHDDSLSTWVMWDSTYEEYCGEFWDLIEHPEKMMPGTWID